MTSRSLRDLLLGCPVCGRHAIHALFCQRRHDMRRCRCPWCYGRRAGYHEATVDDIKLRELSAKFTAEEVDALARIRREAA